MYDIKRSVEAYLVSQLASIDGNLKFYMAKGGSAEDNSALAGSIVPPFGIVNVEEAEEMATGANLYTLHGTVVLITQLQDTGSQQHAEWVAGIKKVMDQVNESCQSDALRPVNYDFALHGLDTFGNKSSASAEDMAHADAIAFTAGATALPQLTTA